MEKPNRIAVIYGYAVCLVTVITVLISVTAIVTAIIDLSDPIHAWGQRGPSLASFENYKMDTLKSQKESAYVPDDQTIRNMYEAAKTDRIQSVRHRSHRSIITSGLLTLICIALFGTHWRWLNRLP